MPTLIRVSYEDQAQACPMDLQHADDNLLSVGQVGEFAANNMKLNDAG